MKKGFWWTLYWGGIILVLISAVTEPFNPTGIAIHGISLELFFGAIGFASTTLAARNGYWRY